MTAKATRCPICEAALPGGLAEFPDFPFCSKRCRTIDLGRWLGEGYKVPASGENRSTPAADDEE